ncbi:MAG: hypothetical protein ACLT5P_12125 [Flavonifractor plautii]
MKTLVIKQRPQNNIGVIKEQAGEAVIHAVLPATGAGLVEPGCRRRASAASYQRPAEAAACDGLWRRFCARPTVDRARAAHRPERGVHRGLGGRAASAWRGGLSVLEATSGRPA